MQRLRRAHWLFLPPGPSRGGGSRLTESRARASRDHVGRQTGTGKGGTSQNLHGRSPQTLVGNVREATETMALGAGRDQTSWRCLRFYGLNYVVVSQGHVSPQPPEPLLMSLVNMCSSCQSSIFYFKTIVNNFTDFS